MVKLKKVLAVLLTLAILLAMVPVTALAAETEEVPAEVVETGEEELPEEESAPPEETAETIEAEKDTTDLDDQELPGGESIVHGEAAGATKETAIPLTLDETITASTYYDDDGSSNDGVVYFSFTPLESEFYSFKLIEESDFCPHLISLEDQDGNAVAYEEKPYGYAGALYSSIALTADITYYFLVEEAMYADVRACISVDELDRLTLDETVSVSLGEGEEKWFRYVPEESGFYRFASSGDTDTYCTLYDADRNYLSDDDDGGDNYNFALKYFMEAGQEYLFQVETYSSSASSFTVCLSRDETGGDDNEVTVLTLDETVSVSLGESESMWFRYVPEESGYYRFTSSGDTDTYCTLYDADQNYLNYDDDGGDDYNFALKCFMEAGQAYLFQVETYSGSTASFTVCLRQYVPETSGTCGDNLIWALDEDGVLTISGTGEMDYDYCWPWEDIANRIVTVVIADGVTSIGYEAFCFCDSLTSVTIPGSVTSIGSWAFGGCSKLTSVILPDSVTSIGNGAFADTPWWETQLETQGDFVVLCHILMVYQGEGGAVTIPSGVTSVGDSAFEYCESLTSVVIPNGVTSVGEDTFYNCSSLTSVAFPNSLTSIGEWAFYGCENLNSVTIPASVTDIGYEAFGYYGYDSGEYNTVKKLIIRGYAGTAAQEYAEENGFTFVDLNASQLSTPVLSKVENVNGGVQVTWGKVAGATKYRVFCKTSGGSWKQVGDTTGTSLTAKSYKDGSNTVALKSGTKYTFTVRCVDSGGKYNSAYDTTGKSITYIAAPVLTAVANASGGVLVTWSKVTGAAQYRVYRRVSGGSWAALGNTTSTSYADTKAAAGTLYAYTVRCVSADGKTFTSGYDTTGKGIVRLTNPAVTVANATAGVNVQWSKVAGAKGYYVYRKTGSGSYSKIATITSGSTVSYGDKTAVGGTTYTYTVRAYNGAYLSSFAGKSIVRLTNPAVTVANASGGVVVSWSKVAGAKGYYVYRKTSGGSYTRIKTITSGSTVSVGDTAVKSTNGTLYTYTVRAYNGSVLSSFAGKNIVRLTTPTISSVTNSASKAITVKWNRNTTATGYQVYYKVGTTAKAVTVAGNANLSKVITGLTKGSTYTVYVRSYKTVSGVIYYSGWSAAKTVKISK